MKKIVSILLTAILAVAAACSLVACTDGGNSSGSSKTGVFYKKINGVYTIYKYVEEDGVSELDLGSVISAAGISNVSIKKGAFDGNTSLKKIVVPSTVTEIQAGAFRNMHNLEALEVPFVGKNANSDAFYAESATAVGKSVNSERTIAHFFGTDEYDAGKAITVKYGSGSVTCYVPYKFSEVIVNSASDYSIPWNAFNGAVNIKNIEIKGSVKAIGEGAFSGCASLESVNIPASVTQIYKDAFNGCTKLKTVYLNGNIAIGESAFAGCSAIAYIGKNLSALPTEKTVDFEYMGTVGENAFDFGNEYVTYKAINADAIVLAEVFGKTKAEK